MASHGIKVSLLSHRVKCTNAVVHRKFKLPARPKFTPVRGCPVLGSASDKKNSVNLALVLGLNRILIQYTES